MRGGCLFMIVAVFLAICGASLPGFLYIVIPLILCSTGVFIVGSIEAKSSGRIEGTHNCMTCRHTWVH